MGDEPAFDEPPVKAVRPWVWLAALGVAWGGFWFTVFVIVPLNVARFNSFGLMLPPLTKGVLDVSVGLTKWWFVWIPLSIAAFVALAVTIRTGMVSAKAGKRVAQVATILLLASIFVTGFALAVPLAKLVYGLSK